MTLVAEESIGYGTPATMYEADDTGPPIADVADGLLANVARPRIQVTGPCIWVAIALPSTTQAVLCATAFAIIASVAKI